MEKNLYREFIATSFKVDESDHWNDICQANYFLNRLKSYGIIEGDDFYDNGRFIGLDFWPDRGWGAEMTKLMTFSGTTKESPF